MGNVFGGGDGRGLDLSNGGTEVFVDAGLGTVTDEVTDEHHRFAAAWAELQRNPLTYEGGGAVLADGTRMALLAPVAQHVRFYRTELADFTNGEVAFARDGGQLVVMAWFQHRPLPGLSAFALDER